MNFPKLFLLVNIDEAIKYSESRRNIAPKIYNDRRLKEKAVKPRSGLSLHKFFRLQPGAVPKVGPYPSSSAFFSASSSSSSSSSTSSSSSPASSPPSSPLLRVSQPQSSGAMVQSTEETPNQSISNVNPGNISKFTSTFNEKEVNSVVEKAILIQIYSNYFNSGYW